MKSKALPGTRNNLLHFVLTVLMIIVYSCKGPKGDEDQQQKQPEVQVQAPSFNPDSAYSFTAAQVAFGPRVPNTPSHVECGDYLVETMKLYADTVIVQAATVKAFNGKDLKIRNIISSYRPDLRNRVMLCAHWDSRPFADQDSARRDQPIDAANDGAASCAVLMEVGRMLHMQKPTVGVDIIFFDAEDYGQPDDSPLPRKEDTYCLGSQYWSHNLHKPEYFAAYGILLDMVAAENATFTKEGTSVQYASSVVDKVWKNASRLGYSDYFLYRETAPIIDDHYYINQIVHIPVMDIVHRDAGTGSNFWKHWHTHEDTMDKISRNSMKAVGQTLLETIFRETNP